nr:U1 small nuclear ribonucleoprotein 70 kDa [Tanacetum cinerariifolium]
MINDHEVGGKCFCFVTFTNPRSAIDAIKDMDGRKIEGRIARVNEVKSKGGRSNFGRHNFRPNYNRDLELDKGRDRDRDRDYGRVRDRSRDQNREWSGDRDQVKERGYDRARDIDRTGERFIDRNREHDRDKDMNT